MNNIETLDWTAVQRNMSPYEEQLRKYVDLLVEYGGRVRLTGPADRDQLWRVHILDCAAALPFLPAQGSAVDVGTGGGLPGLVWAICRPRLLVTLIDSIGKKAAVLREIVAELKIENASVCCCRSEELAIERRESFDVAAARAVSRAGVVAEYLSPLVRKGGSVIEYKGPGYVDEIASIGGKWPLLGLDEPQAHYYSIEDRDRYLLTWKKVLPCPDRFPRRPGMAEKRIWWR